MKKIIERVMWDKINVVSVIGIILTVVFAVYTKEAFANKDVFITIATCIVCCLSIIVNVLCLFLTVKDIIDEHKSKQEFASNLYMKNKEDVEIDTIINKFNNSIFKLVQDTTFSVWDMKQQIECRKQQVKKELYQLEINRKNHEFLMQFYA